VRGGIQPLKGLNHGGEKILIQNMPEKGRLKGVPKGRFINNAKGGEGRECLIVNSCGKLAGERN